MESATRIPKPISQVAENVTIVTAEDIRVMNAHTLSEVLDRVTGVFMNWQGYHFGAAVLPHILGSDETDLTVGGDSRHVLVLLDGMPWNSLTSGPYLNTIPVEIVDRIEILKGPASSTWGSSLGGVINVLTKGTGSTAVPHGAASYSYGERGTWDGRVEGAGAAGPVGYFLYGGNQHAEWDRPRAEFDDPSGFAKATVRLSSWANLTLSGGYSKPDASNVGVASYAVRFENEQEVGFGRAALDLSPGPTVATHLAFYQYDQRISQPIRFSGVRPPWWDDSYGAIPSEGDLFSWNRFDEKHDGLEARGSWASPWGVAVVGVDYDHNELIHSKELAGFAATKYRYTPSLSRVGVYANHTLSLGSATITTGLRYDDTNETAPFWSPSAGVALRLGLNTILRGQVARGFAYPSLAEISMYGALRPEKLWSFEMGAETKALPWLWLKGTAFRHELSDTIEWKDVGPKNAGSSHRTGVEVETETVRALGISLNGGFAYIRIDKSDDFRDQDIYQANLGLTYEGFVRAVLHGHLVWWDYGAGYSEGDYTDFIWDLAVSKRLWERQNFALEVFGTFRNLFNGKRSDDVGGTQLGTEKRNVEAGVRFNF